MTWLWLFGWTHDYDPWLGVKDPRRSSYDPRLNSRTGGISLADVPYFDIDLWHQDLTQGQQHSRKHPLACGKWHKTNSAFNDEHDS